MSYLTYSVIMKRLRNIDLEYIEIEILKRETRELKKNDETLRASTASRQP